MPSPMMDLKGLSSAYHLSEDVHFPNERQVGFWKSEAMSDQNGPLGGKFFTSSTLSKLSRMELPVTMSANLLEPFPMREENVNVSLDAKAPARDRHFTQSLALLGTADYAPGLKTSLNGKPAPHLTEGDRIDLMGARSENSLFSSSLSELFSRKMKLTSNSAMYGHSVDTVHYEEEEVLESLEEIEAQTIGNLLPDDDDLLSGVTDGLDFLAQPKAGDDAEDLDLFSSVGGMDLEDDGLSAGQEKFEFTGGVSPSGNNASIAGEHPYGEHPSRTLFVRNINSNVEDAELRALFEQYGGIRTLYTACKHRGFVMISYYDIRAARTAMKALQNKPLRRRKLDIHYSIPKDNPSEKDINQGTLVVFNLDSSVSNDELRHIFGVYGEVKEIRETLHRNNHKFVEFYDVRAAEAALRALNRSNIAGKQIKVEPSRPGGVRRVHQLPQDLEQDEIDLFMLQNSPTNNSTVRISGPPLETITSKSVDNGASLGMHSVGSPFLEAAFHQGISSSVPSSLPSLMRVGSVGNYPGITESGYSKGQLSFDVQPAAGIHPHSLPEYHDGLSNGIPCNSSNIMGANFNQIPPERMDHRQLCRVGSEGHSLGLNEGVFGAALNGSQPPAGHHRTWSNSCSPQPPSLLWPNSPSFIGGISNARPLPRLHGLPGAPSQMLNTVFSMNSHSVGSAPAFNSSIWDLQQPYIGESPEASGFRHVSLGNMRISGGSLHSVDFVPHNIIHQASRNCVDLPIAPRNVGLQSHHQQGIMFPGRGHMMPVATSFDPSNERTRNRRNDGASNQVDNKKQYELDIDRIMRGEDNRTTLMIKNIPNKYTSKMLLAAIDERHRGTYDFIYLPIDFKNKCNVGYAFINMTEPSQIIPFYKAFNGKKWEKFNSEKVATLAYARIQGKAALIAHFQNSSLMNEDKRCRPILFHTEGPNAGDQVPFPMGVNVRTRPGKMRTNILEENSLGSFPTMADGEDSSNGLDATASSAKDLD
ncbi:protein MEI2-like 4 [Rhodamnia argentea]|uniref:Protein MEI2-like 4 n=1 Tax=Rhodamnia argentea TaxID=178133 RepID=A0A8B8PZ19_9MYRT|nr:protein MEI2-like 4 [Rhodamnia argentea]XP_048135423.1 protein MEI2-like 4 [Rhodamnia argentea]